MTLTIIEFLIFLSVLCLVNIIMYKVGFHQGAKKGKLDIPQNRVLFSLFK